MGILDLFLGSKDERVAKRYMAALREAGETRQLTYDSVERRIVVLDGQGTR